ncbi:ABC1 family-domain-containing protein [Phakopsora pachyrhizi]|uniref:ABC1 family-domain-containing protein n=1 Tax=Phakopsora pachyrhizi TaxID=170000 RepID=A0AAV0AVK8_PHAPC|nr:ABC1 family-domain-containing protein [Phakopsora pachyrhizi]
MFRTVVVRSKKNLNTIAPRNLSNYHQHQSIILSRDLLSRPIGSIIQPLRTSSCSHYTRSFKTESNPFQRKPKSFGGLVGTVIGLTAIVWTVDKFVYSESLERTIRLAYNSLIIILDYKLNFNSENHQSTESLHRRVSKRLSETFIKNSGLYIKLGQSVAIQSSLLPRSYQEDFEKMFDSSTSNKMTEKQLLTVFRREFGDEGFEFDKIFEQFDVEPVGVGSIAQVHRAELLNGQIVAVKVQRPEIQNQLEFDLFAYRTLLYVIEKVFDLPVHSFGNYVSEQIRKETDFLNEASNSERSSKLIENDNYLKDHVIVPKVDWKLTSSRILVTEFVNDTNRLTDIKRIEDRGLDKGEVIEIGIRLISKMIFEFGWLHCDLHPGNLLVMNDPINLKKPKLVLIDHGLYIELSETFRKEYCELWKSIFMFDYESVEKICRGWGIGNSEFFASATVLQSITKSKKNQKVIGKKMTNDYEKSLRIKENLKKLLENENLVPKELIFIGRSMRMIQANNQTLGSPVNRIKILTHDAIKQVNSTNSIFSLILRTIIFEFKKITLSKKVFDGIKEDHKGVFFKSLVGLIKIKINLFLIEIGFYLIKVRQSFLTFKRWIRFDYLIEIGRGKKHVKSTEGAGEGFEDLLEEQIRSFVKEEIGIELNNQAFIG